MFFRLKYANIFGSQCMNNSCFTFGIKCNLGQSDFGKTNSWNIFSGHIYVRRLLLDRKNKKNIFIVRQMFMSHFAGTDVINKFNIRVCSNVMLK